MHSASVCEPFGKKNKRPPVYLEGIPLYLIQFKGGGQHSSIRPLYNKKFSVVGNTSTGLIRGHTSPSGRPKDNERGGRASAVVECILTDNDSRSKLATATTEGNV
ncbi:hypothetical protein PROFUN_11616 [Planoprotostelium fungivorum]|uniref:Uncharacterized protein n=1 Tax=Planoprotostelium fungivorum TaxID=1890364 RepID=A0A2P6N2B8_9EUKA|nr:hypothetical protein PROFUN_11616 [Planoprotostelium fungivorum]